MESAQKASPAYSITQKDDQILVTTAFNPHFVQFARAAGATWNGTDRTWAFPESHRPVVEKACRQIFDRGMGAKAGVLRKGMNLASGIARPGVKLAVHATRATVQTIAYGMNGMRGVSNARALMGKAPEFKKSGVDTNFSMGIHEMGSMNPQLSQGLSR